MRSKLQANQTLVNLRASRVTPVIDERDPFDDDFDAAGIFDGLSGLEALGFSVIEGTSGSHDSFDGYAEESASWMANAKYGLVGGAKLRQDPVMSRRQGDRLTRRLAALADLEDVMSSAPFSL